eukprot:s2849_g8.t1
MDFAEAPKPAVQWGGLRCRAMLVERSRWQTLKGSMHRISESVQCTVPSAFFRLSRSRGLRQSGVILRAVMMVMAMAAALLLVFPASFVLPRPCGSRFMEHTPSGLGQAMPSSVGCLMGATVALFVAAGRQPLRWSQRRARGGESQIAQELISMDLGALTAQRHRFPTSQWHCVSLFACDRLDDDTGLLHFVNEIPRGSLKKFEVQTQLENNVIREDLIGSERLKSLGQPVPFNYGCFPQTYRDPRQYDEIHNAPGDDDPLDVIDVSPGKLSVGQLTTCRPLGAVCLIDEGKADWKIFVTSHLSGPGADLRSMEDVEFLWPGRTMEILSWMDQFKQHQNTAATRLHYEVHSAEVAMAIVRKDHQAWRELLKEVDESGFARGHWVGRTAVRAVPESIP